MARFLRGCFSWLLWLASPVRVRWLLRRRRLWLLSWRLWFVRVAASRLVARLAAMRSCGRRVLQRRCFVRRRSASGVRRSRAALPRWWRRSRRRVLAVASWRSRRRRVPLACRRRLRRRGASRASGLARGRPSRWRLAVAFRSSSFRSAVRRRGCRRGGVVRGRRVRVRSRAGFASLRLCLCLVLLNGLSFVCFPNGHIATCERQTNSR